MSNWTLDTVQSALQTQGLDGWLLYDFRGSNPVAVQASGLPQTGTRRWFLWIPAQGPAQLLIHAIEQSTFRDFNSRLPVAVQTYVGWRDLHRALAGLLAAARRIAMEFSPRNAIPYLDFVDGGVLELVRGSGQVEIVSSADLVQQFQAVLTSAQVASHRRTAAKVLQVKTEAFAYVAHALATGQALDEFALQEFIVARLIHLELEPMHRPIVAVNAHAADPHYEPTARRHAAIAPGDMLLLDLWGKSQGESDACFADVTWTAFCGSAVPPQAARIFEIVRQARDTCLAYIQTRLRAGDPVRGCDADDVCRQVISAAGYGDAFLHRTGHSLGPEVHFSGANIDNLETEDNRALVPGLLFTIEPGIYLPHCDFDDTGRPRGLGIRSEVNCLVRAGDLEVTTVPLQDQIVALLP